MIAIVWSSISSAIASTSAERRLRVDRRDPQLDAEQVAALVERRVAGLGLHEVRSRHAAGLPGVLAVGDQRVQDRAGPAGRHQTRRLAVGHGLGVHQVEGHRDDLALELGLARAHVALQGVHVGEHPERLAEEVVVIVVAAVHRPRDLAGLPEGVLLLRHRPHLGEHVVARPAAVRERAVDGEPVGVRKVVHDPGSYGWGTLRPMTEGTAADTSWLESMPEVYDRCLGLAIFAPFAADIALRAVDVAERPRARARRRHRHRDRRPGRGAARRRDHGHRPEPADGPLRLPPCGRPGLAGGRRPGPPLRRRLLRPGGAASSG